MKLLLTNDDGIEAHGLAALLTAARSLGEPVIVAPTVCHSCGSHRVTNDKPLRVEERGPSRFALDGTPADCVRIGLHALTPDVAWVLAGINHGGNLGTDVYHSGTVAAAREAVLHGRPAVAVSHYRRRDLDFSWDRAAALVAPILRSLVTRSWEPSTLWNINLPHLTPDAPDPEVVFCPLNPSPLPLAFRRDGDTFRYAGDYHGRLREPGSDVDHCFRGRIAVTLLRL